MSIHPDDKHLIEAYMGGSWGYFGDWNSLMTVIEKISQHVYEIVDVDDGITKYQEKDRAHPRTFGLITDDEPSWWMFRFNRSRLHHSDTLFNAAESAVIEWIKSYNDGAYNKTPTL